MILRLEKLIQLVPFIKRCDRELTDLGTWWQQVVMIGKINSLDVAGTLLADMQTTKNHFEELQQNLLENLSQEMLGKVNQELGARAQVSIDILVRNLFERTADIGFLATDEDVRSFLCLDHPSADDTAKIVARLSEYVAKYSVYDEVIILDPAGRVRAHLDERNSLGAASNDPLITRLLLSSDPYLEIFRPSDLQPKQRAAHIFATRVTESDDRNAPALGVLCLCFRFDNEMADIFAQMKQSNELIAILDESGKVIATSDETQLAFGSRISVGKEDGLYPLSHKGQDYLARTLSTDGYQGYRGLSWRGHVMQSVASVFSEQDTHQVESKVDAGEHANFGELFEISRKAARVTDDLKLAVLNGQIAAAKRNARTFVPVLTEIRNIGERTREVFDRSILKLHSTIRDALLSNAQFHAFLAIDIMDRNLYERANDVRWWAQTSRFREVMSQPGQISHEGRNLSAILAYINNLYTVYSNLFLFDKGGFIVAVSNQSKAALVGAPLPASLPFKEVFDVRLSHQYKVSDFEPSPLYGDRPTYIYMTSILQPGRDQVVGGIGIVFDSETEFRAMLEDALPRNSSGAVIEGVFGLFMETGGRIVASTLDGLVPGDLCHEFDSLLSVIHGGQRVARLVSFKERRYVVGASMSGGYREYKTSGDYVNEIVALIFIPV